MINSDSVQVCGKGDLNLHYCITCTWISLCESIWKDAEYRIKFLKLKYNIPDSVSSTGRTTKGEFEIDWTGYADDLVLIFEDHESLQKGIAILDKLFTQYGMKINVSKTKTMIFNHQDTEKEKYPSTIATLNGEDLENVKVFRYLGSDIKFDESSTGEAELNLRTDAATGKFYTHSRNMMNQKIYMKNKGLNAEFSSS